jgi:hypothetical protein
MEKTKRMPANRLLRRSQAPAYLLEAHEIKRAASTLAGEAHKGIGPEITYVGKVPHYRVSALDDYARELISKPTRRARKYPRPRDGELSEPAPTERAEPKAAMQKRHARAQQESLAS